MGGGRSARHQIARPLVVEDVPFVVDRGCAENTAIVIGRLAAVGPIQKAPETDLCSLFLVYFVFLGSAMSY